MKYDGYKTLPAVQVPATVELVQLLPQCRHRVPYKTLVDTVSSALSHCSTENKFSHNPVSKMIQLCRT